MEVGSEAEYSVSDRAVSTAKLETIMTAHWRDINNSFHVIPGVVVVW